MLSMVLLIILGGGLGISMPVLPLARASTSCQHFARRGVATQGVLALGGSSSNSIFLGFVAAAGLGATARC